MSLLRIVRAPGLLVRVQSALGMSQAGLGKLIGCSRRTMVRYSQGRHGPSIAVWHLLAREVFTKQPLLAEEIARETGETLESLGIVKPSPPPMPPPTPAMVQARPAPPIGDLVDSIVCAAAEAVATTPQAIRPALRAAFDRAASVGVAIEEVRAVLRPAGGKKSPTKAGNGGSMKATSRSPR